MSPGLLFSWPIATAKRIAVLVSFAGATALLGWAFDFPRLKSILPGLPKMSPLTALLFVVSGLALWITARWPSDWCDSNQNKTWTHSPAIVYRLCSDCGGSRWIALGILFFRTRSRFRSTG